MYNFQTPGWFFLLLLIPLLVWFDFYFFKRFTPKIVLPTLHILIPLQKRSSFFRFIPIILKSLIVLFLVAALARPRLTLEKREHTTMGVDIVLVIDVSGSMFAVDFKPQNRIEAAKEVAKNFINHRLDDRLGIVTFGTYAYTLLPLTNDFNSLQTVLAGINAGEDQQTAIGNGIAIATLRLKDSEAESKIIILLTDGVNNAGQIDPITAAEMAKTFNIKLYAIGIGTKGPVDFPYQHPIFGTQYQKVNIDMDIDALHKLAAIGGTERAAIASNTEQLQLIFDEIDRLEKTEIKANVYYEHKEFFLYFIYLAVLAMIILLVFRSLLRMVLP